MSMPLVTNIKYLTDRFVLRIPELQGQLVCTLLKMFFIAMRKPCRWLSPSLLCSLLPHASTLATSVMRTLPSCPHRQSRTSTLSDGNGTFIGRHLRKRTFVAHITLTLFNADAFHHTSSTITRVNQKQILDHNKA